MLVAESPTRNAAWVRSGEMPTCISIGTNTGAISPHFAEAEPMNRLTSPTMRMTPHTVSGPGIAKARSKSAPLMDSNTPKLDSPKSQMNWAQKNANTM